MDIRKNESASSTIVYSCYHQASRDGEHFVPEHTLIYQIAGSLILNDGSQEYAPHPGSFRLIRRNQLIKFVKYPPVDGDFKSLSIYLNQGTLKNFSQEYGFSASDKDYGLPVIDLETDIALKQYIQSLLSYQQSGSLKSRQLIELKVKEGLLLLLQANPGLKNILFDFTEPHKIDLAAFMNKNYRFNVRLERLAYLTGRSLATFKRDFGRTFGCSPARWLQQKRLQEAHYLIEKGEKSSRIYLELGFENLSHFSYAYKKMYGNPPSIKQSTGRT
ncbi:AraC family transcriptional regulator [Pedobacter sp. P351]|uniref:AraC family transcriptional regulator n=1 Tax=Pedobacter superstes TaxID=3133441 RepID=UPI00309FCC1C